MTHSTYGHAGKPPCGPPGQPVFECAHGVLTVGAEPGVEAVMEQNDVAWANST